MFLKFLFSIILVEAITGILSKSELFNPIREWFFNRRINKVFNFIHRVLDCPYCTSVWVSFFVYILLFINTEIVDRYIDWFVISLFLHRLSNILHFIIDRLNKNRDNNYNNILDD